MESASPQVPFATREVSHYARLMEKFIAAEKAIGVHKDMSQRVGYALQQKSKAARAELEAEWDRLRREVDLAKKCAAE